MFANGNLYEIVNGALLPQFNGKKVNITGLVTQINPNGLSIDIRTVDDVPLKVNFKKPFRDNLEGFIEIHGVAQGKSIICDELILFALEQSKDFDTSAHNHLCKFLHTIDGIYNTA